MSDDSTMAIINVNSKGSKPASTNVTDSTLKDASISIAIDPVALITTECITVTSAMRKHSRWAHATVSTILGGSAGSSHATAQISRPSTPKDGVDRKNSKGYDEDATLASRWGLRGKKGKSMQDNPLMASFGRLRRELSGCKGRFGRSQGSKCLPFVRYKDVRYSGSTTSIPTSYPGICNIGSHNVTGARFNHKILRVQSHMRRVAALVCSHAVVVGRYNALPIRSK